MQKGGRKGGKERKGVEEGSGAGRKGGRLPAELGYSEHFFWPN